MGWKGAVVGGIIGYLIGLFFKSFILVLITFKVPPLEQYLIGTFIPVSGIDFIRFFTVPLPFALLGAALGVLRTRRMEEAETVAAPRG